MGEVVNDRYEVFATHGRGVFSSVLRARDRHRKAPDGSVAEVAIKIIRANETMHKVQSEGQSLVHTYFASSQGHLIWLMQPKRGVSCAVAAPVKYVFQ